MLCGKDNRSPPALPSNAVRAVLDLTFYELDCAGRN